MEDRRIELYQELYDMTKDECKNCRIPYSCCSGEYCEMTIDYAKEAWGVELQRTDHPKLPLMGPNGCTAAPHLRPNCTAHTCAVNSAGFKPNDDKWNDRYFELRRLIDIEELKHWV